MKKKISFILLSTFIAVFVLGTAFYLYMNSQKVSTSLELEDNATLGIMPGVDMEQRKKELQEKLDKNMIAFSINTNPTFLNGISEGNIMIENPEQNAKLIVAEIYLSDSKELLYKTKALKPGSYIENIKLDKELAKGEYNATVYFKGYDQDTQEYIGQTGAEITLHIQENSNI